MKIIREFSKFQPWSGAVPVWDAINRHGLIDSLESVFDEFFDGEPQDEVTINNMLWFDSGMILFSLGLIADPDDDYDIDEI